ncbi:hypothetical protein ABIA32_002372 [Streptacidiphilus sp. MAP12-20]|uniref:anti-sigma factor antagonist n=1 Tax=Streptacidiphilus sp. MAP12-20 TaxID=3156299 RepID=UPI003517356C
MTIQWHLTTRPTADVLQISGFLGDDAVSRFTGAIGWAVARGDGPLLLDLTHLKGWSTAGRDAVAQAALQLERESRTLELVAAPGDAVLLTTDAPVTLHQDLDAALAAHAHPRAETGGESPPRSSW